MTAYWFANEGVLQENGVIGHKQCDAAFGHFTDSSPFTASRSCSHPRELTQDVADTGAARRTALDLGLEIGILDVSARAATMMRLASIKAQGQIKSSQGLTSD